MILYIIVIPLEAYYCITCMLGSPLQDGVPMNKLHSHYKSFEVSVNTGFPRV